MLIRIIPIGEMSEKLLQNLYNELEEVLKARSRMFAKIEVSQDAFNFWRKQYDAEKIIDQMKKSLKPIDKSIPTLGITEKDIFYNGLSFVFGLEDPSQGYSLISTARLKPEFYNEKSNFTLLSERTIKEAIHEIGHHLGLEHCAHPFCVMNFSPSVNDVDKKQKYFCNNCKIKLSMKGVNID